MNPKILVVGDVMLDRYIHGTVERISPEAPIPILRQTHIEDRPGGAANVACNLASLWADVHLAGSFGGDEAGDALVALLTKAGVRGVMAPQCERTTIKARYVAMGQQMLRTDQDGDRPNDAALEVLASAVGRMVGSIHAMVLSDYAGGVLADPQPMIQRARKAGIPVYVDPKGTDWDRYRGATLIKPNEIEAREQFEWDTPEEMRTGALHMMTLHNIEAMLITHGAGGMTLIQDDGKVHHQPAKSGPVVDVTGAGDTVLAVVAYLRAMGGDWPDVLRMAALGAAAVCARHGTSVVTLTDIEMA